MASRTASSSVVSKWVPLAAICFGNFVIGTGTLIVPGMLPALADGLRVSLPVAGQLITAFAFTVCVGAPLLAAVTSRIERRTLLVTTQLLFFAGHAAAALLSDFVPMLGARIVTAVGAALFTAQAAATSTLLVLPEERGRAIAFAFLGWSIASVIGMPLGAYVGETYGWRTGFALVAAAALAAAGAVRIGLPAGLRTAPMNFAMWRKLFGHPIILLVVAVTAIQSSAQNTVFFYLVPGMKAFVDATPATVSALLAAFGIAGVVGNAFVGQLADRHGAATLVLWAMLAMLAGHLLWPWSAGSLPVLALSIVVWGLGCFATNSAQQARLAGLSPAHAPVSLALNTSAVYLGHAVGAAAGGALLVGVLGPSAFASLTVLSVPLFLLAIGLSIYAARRCRTIRNP